MVTPIHVCELQRLLKTSGYDQQKTKILIDGFKCGFDLGYRGPEKRRDTSSNIPIREGVGSLTELWNKVMKEVKEHRYAGPFEELPFDYYVQSPIGLVPKDENKTRLIFHLSYDFDGDNEARKSINYHTPSELCTVKYKDLDHAVLNSLRILKQTEGNNSKLFYSKSDCSHAFRILPMLVKYRKFLVMKAMHPITKRWFYFIDKCLPFGASISCANFQSFSDALAFIVKWKIECTLYITNLALTNYLDDFLFISLTIQQGNNMIKIFLDISQLVGCPISEEKTEWSTQIITFLGTLLNGGTLTISVPVEKCDKAINLLQTALVKKKVTVKFIQRLTGTLNFLNRAIVPGRAFTRGMYTKLKLKNSKGVLLKDHHHMNLNREFLMDCEMWKRFLTNQSQTGICRPFVDFSEDRTFTYTSLVTDFYSDASWNPVLGMGATFDNRRWLWKQWPGGFVQKYEPSIEYLELYALVSAMVTWRDEEALNNAQVTIFCDNEAVVHMVNNLASSCPHCLRLIRVLVLENLNCNRRVFCKHIRSELNILSDALSHLDFNRFWKNAPKTMCSYSDKISEKLWPIDKFWQNNKYLNQF